MDPGSRFQQVSTHNYVSHNQITRNEGGGGLSVKIQIPDLNQLSIYSIIFSYLLVWDCHDALYPCRPVK